MRVGLLTMTLLVGGACSSPDLPADGLGTIVEVVDGDTVVVDLAGHRETVRLLGIDTPPTDRLSASVLRHRRDSAYCWFPAAGCW